MTNLIYLFIFSIAVKIESTFKIFSINGDFVKFELSSYFPSSKSNSMVKINSQKINEYFKLKKIQDRCKSLLFAKTFNSFHKCYEIPNLLLGIIYDFSTPINIELHFIKKNESLKEQLTIYSQPLNPNTYTDQLIALYNNNSIFIHGSIVDFSYMPKEITSYLYAKHSFLNVISSLYNMDRPALIQLSTNFQALYINSHHSYTCINISSPSYYTNEIKNNRIITAFGEFQDIVLHDHSESPCYIICINAKCNKVCAQNVIAYNSTINSLFCQNLYNYNSDINDINQKCTLNTLNSNEVANNLIAKVSYSKPNITNKFACTIKNNPLLQCMNLVD